MKNLRTSPVLIAAFALAFPLTVTTNDGGTNSDRARDVAPDDEIVDFGDPVVLDGPGNHVLVPNEATIGKGGSIIFVVNGAGHGIAIYPVSKNTTREGITAQLCNHDPATNLCVDPAFATENHTILDGKGDAVIVTGMDPPVQRIDDPTDRLFSTTTRVGNLPGEFLTGTTATTLATQLQFRFDKSGRYLAVCTNRNHFMANWMFGFINVGDDHTASQ